MDKQRILADLVENYKVTHKKSEAFYQKAAELQVRGVSHNLRVMEPFPLYDIKAEGSRITDLDGNTYIDFWQGHFTNVLGHNPEIVTEVLARSFEEGKGLITGFPGVYQSELAELILSRVRADKIRFTTSGALATMYAVMLAKSFTQRDYVMKVGGGWHGSQPYLLKGVTTYDQGLEQLESAGLPLGIDPTILVTKFNDTDDLRDKLKKHGDRIACFILEPMVGAGGLIFAQKEYIENARGLTEEHGALLIMDEVITGFRFHAGPLHALYEIKPDLAVFGKTIGGGMPLSAVAGREDVMCLAGPDAPPGRMAKFDGGTFSAHPASMLAGIAFIRHLIENESEIYPRLGHLGKLARRGIEEIFSRHGFRVKCSGDGAPVTENSSMVGVHFLKEDVDRITTPEQVWDPASSDFEIREKIFKLAMLEQGFSVFHGYGGISAAHTEEEIQASLDAAEEIAEKWSI